MRPVFRLRNVWTVRHTEIVRSVGSNGVRELEPNESPHLGDVTDTCNAWMLSFLARYGLRLGAYRECSKTFPVVYIGKEK